MKTNTRKAGIQKEGSKVIDARSTNEKGEINLRLQVASYTFTVKQGSSE